MVGAEKSVVVGVEVVLEGGLLVDVKCVMW